MNKKLRKAFEKNSAKTVEQWQTAVQLFLSDVKLTSVTRLTRSKTVATTFVSDVLWLSGMDIWLYIRGSELGIDFASSALWAEATEKLALLQGRAQVACQVFEFEDFEHLLKDKLVRLGFADPETEPDVPE